MSHNALKLDSFLPYRLSVVSNRVSNLVASQYHSQYGLSIWQWRVIAMLGAEGSRTAQQVADQAAMDKMTVSRAVSGLLERSLVMRTHSKSDRRAHIIELTEEGWAVHDKIAPLAKSQEKVLLAGMSETEIKQLFDLLSELETKAVAAGL